MSGWAQLRSFAYRPKVVSLAGGDVQPRSVDLQLEHLLARDGRRDTHCNEQPRGDTQAWRQQRAAWKSWSRSVWTACGRGVNVACLRLWIGLRQQNVSAVRAYQVGQLQHVADGGHSVEAAVGEGLRE
jgi:hypothetical protein